MRHSSTRMGLLDYEQMHTATVACSCRRTCNSSIWCLPDKKWYACDYWSTSQLTLKVCREGVVGAHQITEDEGPVVCFSFHLHSGRSVLRFYFLGNGGKLQQKLKDRFPLYWQEYLVLCPICLSTNETLKGWGSEDKHQWIISHSFAIL